MTMRSPRLPVLPFGAVVLIEPGIPPEQILGDLQAMKTLHFNTVVVYPSVSRWEGSTPGRTAFGAVDRVMDWCAELGLHVILELQGQVMQDADAPECFGYVQSPNYRENGLHDPQKERLLRAYLQEVAAHFRGHPALLAYDVFNEIGNDSRSPETIGAFVHFLRGQYGEIPALNAAWGTYFSDFEAITQIPPDFRVWTWTSVLAERDWQRFRSRDFAAKIAEWREIIREVDPRTPLFVDVLGSDTLHNRTEAYFGVSDWDAVNESDVLGLSCYANMLSPKWWESGPWLWPQFWRHALGVAGGKQTILSELMTPNRSLFPGEHSSLEDEIRLWSFQALFHGIQGVIYWKYRPFYRGRQVAGRGLTDFAGRPNAFAFQAAEAARFCGEHADRLAVAVPDSGGCAILFDPEIERLFAAIGVGATAGGASDFYTREHRGWFRAFWSQGLAPAYLTPERIGRHVPDAVRVLAAPCLAAASTELLDALKEFVRRGGILLTDARFATLDENGILRPHSPGGGFHEFSGFEEAGFSSRFTDRLSTSGGTLEFSLDHFQKFTIAGGTSVVRVTEGGAPAILERENGAGRHWHFAFLLGHKIEAAPCPALALFADLIPRLQEALRPTVETLCKGAETDISTLLDPDGRPWLVGVTNYAHTRDVLEIRVPGHSGVLRSAGGNATKIEAGAAVRLEIAPRAAEAWFFSPGGCP